MVRARDPAVAGPVENVVVLFEEKVKVSNGLFVKNGSAARRAARALAPRSSGAFLRLFQNSTCFLFRVLKLTHTRRFGPSFHSYVEK